jgi:hypothetical protein
MRRQPKGTNTSWLPKINKELAGMRSAKDEKYKKMLANANMRVVASSKKNQYVQYIQKNKMARGESSAEQDIKDQDSAEAKTVRYT